MSKPPDPVRPQASRRWRRGLLLLAASAVLGGLLVIGIVNNVGVGNLLRFELVAVVGGLLMETVRRTARHRGRAPAGHRVPLGFSVLILGIALGVVHLWIEPSGGAAGSAWVVLLPLGAMALIGQVLGRLQKSWDEFKEYEWYNTRIKELVSDEKGAVVTARTLDRNMSAQDVVRREDRLLDTLFETVSGDSGKTVSLLDLARAAQLDAGRVKSVLDPLQKDGSVRVVAAYEHNYEHWARKRLPLTEWTDQSVSITGKGRARVQGHHDRTGKAGNVNHKYEFNAPVTAGIIGSDIKVRQLKVTGKIESGEAFQSLLQAVRSVQTQVHDTQQAAALGDELGVLEGDSGEPEKTAAVQRLVGMSRILGSVADPILDAANKLKDLLA